MFDYGQGVVSWENGHRMAARMTVGMRNQIREQFPNVRFGAFHAKEAAHYKIDWTATSGASEKVGERANP
jgi:hypothetical protein